MRYSKLVLMVRDEKEKQTPEYYEKLVLGKYASYYDILNFYKKFLGFHDFLTNLSTIQKLEIINKFWYYLEYDTDGFTEKELAKFKENNKIIFGLEKLEDGDFIPLNILFAFCDRTQYDKIMTRINLGKKFLWD